MELTKSPTGHKTLSQQSHKLSVDKVTAKLVSYFKSALSKVWVGTEKRHNSLTKTSALNIRKRPTERIKIV